MRIVVGITGASGVGIGVRLIGALHGHEVSAVVTDAAWEIIELELGGRPELPCAAVYDAGDFSAPLASGSCLFDAMVVAPCSMKTLAGIAAGYADTLVIRAADNALRCGRKLVLAPRETPLSLSALENMAKLRSAGAVIAPPMLAFYFHPRSIDDMIDYSVGKLLDVLGIEHSLYRRWGE